MTESRKMDYEVKHLMEEESVMVGYMNVINGTLEEKYVRTLRFNADRCPWLGQPGNKILK